MRPLHSIAALITIIIWGGNFVACKYALDSFPPFLLTALRFGVVALILVLFLPKPTRKQWGDLLALSFTLGTLHFALVIAGLYRGLDIASTALAAQMGVPFTCLMSAIVFKDRLGLWRTMGMVVAFIGIMIITGTPHVLDHLFGFSLALAGAFFWGAANIFMKRLSGMHGLHVMGWMATLALPQLALVSWAIESDSWIPLAEAPPVAWAAVVYTGIASTIVAYGLWYYLLARYAISQVAPYMLLVPLFSIGFGQLFFAEPLTWQIFVGGAVLIGGVAVIVMRRPKIMRLGEPV